MGHFSAPPVPPGNPRAPVYLGNNLALCWLLGRFKFFVDSTDSTMTPHFLYDGNWEMNITNLFTKVIHPGNVVLDVGANFGFYTVVAADAVGPRGKVYAIEAGPTNFGILRRNILINAFNDRVTAFHNAALNERKEVQLFQQEIYAGGHSVFVADPKDSKYQRIAIQGVPIDDLIPEGTVDVVKIDVEGCEGLVFQGMTKLLERSRQVKILMEWSPAMIRNSGVEPAAFLGLIRAQGFEVWLINAQSGLDKVSDSQLCASTTIDMLYLTRPLG